MTLLAVERIKLLSTRSPYWCLGAIVAAALLLTLPFSLIDGGSSATVGLSQSGLQLGMMVFMVLAALSMTTEYRFSTIRASFLAMPSRTRVFAAKTALLAVVAALTAAILGPVALLLTRVLARSPDHSLALSSGSDYRQVFGNVALFAIAAVIAISVGALIRQSAGAITILLLWPLLIEGILVPLIPKVGQKISAWLPFNAGGQFVSSAADQQAAASMGGAPPDVQQQIQDALSYQPTPVQGLLVFIAAAVVLWLVALLVLKSRDA